MCALALAAVNRLVFYFFGPQILSVAERSLDLGATAPAQTQFTPESLAAAGCAECRAAK